MTQVIVPLQYFGIGDVIFTQTLVKNIAEGNKILWPVMSQFVDGLNRAYPDVTFIDYKLTAIDFERKYDQEINGVRYLPIRWADSIRNVPYNECMRSKYDLYNQSWQDWKDKAIWQRSRELEYHLFHKVLGLEEGEKFNLVSNVFGSDSSLKLNIAPNNGLRNVEMTTIPHYSLFDWAYVMERATNIYAVSSSIIYILEMIDLVAKEISIYKRAPIEKNHDNYSYILQKHKYNLK